MMKKRVFITGATGNMGWATVQEFMSRLDRFDVMVLARDFVLTRHSSSKLDSALVYSKIRDFCLTTKISSVDLHRFLLAMRVLSYST